MLREILYLLFNKTVLEDIEVRLGIRTLVELEQNDAFHVLALTNIEFEFVKSAQDLVLDESLNNHELVNKLSDRGKKRRITRKKKKGILTAAAFWKSATRPGLVASKCFLRAAM